MGRFTPAWACVLLPAVVLVGLAFVSVPPSTSAVRTAATPAATLANVSRPVVAARPAALVRTGAVASGASCSAGLVALTFDDGPNPAVTPQLVHTLLVLKVPATFFMIGTHVDAHPTVARLVQSRGFTIGNHTWNHPMLTHLSSPAIRDQLNATSSAFKRHYITPSRLMRPPYGDIDDRVRTVVRQLGLIPVLWTIDSRDWAGGDAIAIAHRILTALRPHATNLVLQHDGVANSAASLGAVPIVVRRARERGYCFTHLNATGGVGGH